MENTSTLTESFARLRASLAAQAARWGLLAWILQRLFAPLFRALDALEALAQTLQNPRRPPQNPRARPRVRKAAQGERAPRETGARPSARVLRTESPQIRRIPLPRRQALPSRVPQAQTTPPPAKISKTRL